MIRMERGFMSCSCCRRKASVPAKENTIWVSVETAICAKKENRSRVTRKIGLTATRAHHKEKERPENLGEATVEATST